MDRLTTSEEYPHGAIARIEAMGAGADTYEIEEANVGLKNLLIKFGGQQEGEPWKIGTE